MVVISLVAQEDSKIKLNSVSLSSGKGILSSGLVFKADLSREHDLISIKLSQDDMYLLYLKRVTPRLYAGPSVEFFHNIPVLGLMTNLTLVSGKNFSASTMNWTAISAGDIGERANLAKWDFIFTYQSLDLRYRNLSLSGAALYYHQWILALEGKYNVRLTKNFSVAPSVGYNFSTKETLFCFGASYKF